MLYIKIYLSEQICDKIKCINIVLQQQLENGRHRKFSSGISYYWFILKCSWSSFNINLSVNPLVNLKANAHKQRNLNVTSDDLFFDEILICDAWKIGKK